MGKSWSYSRYSLLAAACLGLAALTSPLKAAMMEPVPMLAVGGPDTFGYRWMDNLETNGPSITLWENISSTGTVIFGSGTDDSVSGALPIGFTFPFYGTDYTQFYCSSNGNIHFSGPSLSYPGVQMPSTNLPNTMIAAMWADLHMSPDGDVRYSGNSTRLIVQWTSVEYYPQANDQTFTFQIRIEPSGTIHVLYQTVTGITTTNGTTCGIENSSGSVGLTYSFNNSPNTLVADRVVRFFLNQPPNAPTGLSQAADSGGASRPLGFVSDATAYFRGAATDPDTANTVGVQVEILPAATPFQAAVTGELTSVGAQVAQGAQAECTYTFDGTPYGSGDYHWRIRTVDQAGGQSAWVVFNAAQVHLTVDLAPPSVPGGPFVPEELASVGVQPGGSDVLFRWGPATDIGPPGPMSYRLQVSASPGFPVNIADEVVAAQEFSVVMQISAAPYYWRVAAIDQAGNQGPYAIPISFFVSFTDSINHGGGDCNISAGSIPGPLLPAAMAALLMAYGWSRRRRA